MSEVQRYRKKPVEIEAVRFTGDNWSVMHAFTGHRLLDGQRTIPDGNPVYADIFNPIGTYLLPDPDQPDHVAELWVEANSAHLPISVGEWIMKDQYGFYPCKGDERAPENYERAGVDGCLHQNVIGQCLDCGRQGVVT